MQILYVSNSPVPSDQAHGLQVMQMCSAFAAQGADTVLYGRQGPIEAEPFAFYGIGRSFDLVRIDPPDIRFIRRLLYALAVIRRLPPAAAPMAIYGRDFYVLGLIVLLGVRRSVPIYFEAHHPPFGRAEAWMQRRLFRSRRFRGLVSISGQLAAAYEAQFPGLRGRICIAHDGAPAPGAPAAPQALACPPGGLKIGYIGSMYPGKGVELIVQLAAELPGCAFHVVGGTPEQVAAYRAQHPLPNLHFHGFVRPEQTPSYLAACDVMLAPYLQTVRVGARQDDIASWMSPLKLFEYMAGGKAMVCSRLPVLEEILTHEEHALLAEPGSLEDWAAQIRRLQDDGALRARLGAQAQAAFRSQYTWGQRAARILAWMGQP